MLVTVGELTYYSKREELTGLVGIKHDGSGKRESCMFTASESKIDFQSGGIGMPDWTWAEMKAVEQRIGQLLRKFKTQAFAYPDSITFVV